MAKNNLEIINEKLNVELEETTKKLNLAESRIPKLEDADTKNWKSIVITRYRWLSVNNHSFNNLNCDSIK